MKLTGPPVNTLGSMVLPLSRALKHHPQVTVVANAWHEGTLKVEPEVRRARTH